MAGEKRFGTALFGFKKQDVNLYIEKIIRDYDDKFREKSEEITNLKKQYKELKLSFDEYKKKQEEMGEDRAKIADVLIKAQEKAQIMVEDARRQADAEKRRIEILVEQEKEKLVEIKEQIKILKSGVVNTLKKYEDQLDDIAADKEDE